MNDQLHTNNDTNMFTEMRDSLKAHFDKMVDDPVNLNNLYEHLAAITSAVDTLIQVSQQMFEMATEPNDEEDQQV